MSAGERHLWEVDHAYYCSESNYYSAERHATYGSWAEFADSEGENDMDLNLVFRWDWTLPWDDDTNTYSLVANPDPYYRDGKLWVFWMGQRKGLFRATETDVCAADEPAVRAWLQARLNHLATLWEPLTPAP